MDTVRAFFLEPTARAQRYLRRYVSLDADLARKCPLGYHNASALIDEIAIEVRPGGCWDADRSDLEFVGDTRWPGMCDCGYRFTADDQWQVFLERIYVRQDSGADVTLHDAPPGAMWDADWLHGVEGWCGPDGRSLIAICPGGHQWHIDGRATNCTMPNDTVHKCWVRHGEPPNLTVDKNGLTCAAGAGSIQTPNWHGFLRSGVFVP